MKCAIDGLEGEKGASELSLYSPAWKGQRKGEVPAQAGHILELHFWVQVSGEDTNLDPPETCALFWSLRAAIQLLLLFGGLLEGLWWCCGFSHGVQWSRCDTGTVQ